MAIPRANIKLYITAAGTNASAVASSDQIKGEIKKYSLGGGEDSVETTPVFGGYVDLQKPRSQYEVDLDIIPDTSSSSQTWDAQVYGTDAVKTTTYSSAVDAGNKMIVIQAFDGTNFKTWAFNNCNATIVKYDHEASDNMTATLSFRFAPMTSSGIPNRISANLAASAMPAWTAMTAGN